MGHLTPKKFTLLQHRLDKAVQGAPESETLLKILEIMFTKDEASYIMNFWGGQKQHFLFFQFLP